jgi:hypothetical protein
MLNGLPPLLIGLVAGLLLLLNTLVWVPCLLLLALAKLLLLFKVVRLRLDPLLVGIAEAWIAGNGGWMRLTQRTAWDVAGNDGLDRRG